MNKYKPIYHFMPEKNWMNDPNGPIYYKGEYHLFYQYNPYGSVWGHMHWGHAKSKDLVHWEHLPIALYPSTQVGEEHCFSGCLVISDQGIPTIFYTSIGSVEKGDRTPKEGAQQWMAVSYDDMITWEKPNSNPVITLEAHGNLEIKEWRDPFVWKEKDTWFMVVGGGYNQKGCALLYQSKDLVKWQFIHKLYEDQEDYTFWECPNFFKLGEKYVLIYSPSDVVKYYIGTWNEDYTFTPEVHGVVDYSGWQGLYAPNSFVDGNERRIMWGWMTEVARGDFYKELEYNGAQAVPRIVSIADNGRLKFEPVYEIQELRKEYKHFESIIISEGNWNPEIQGRALEIQAEFEITDKTDVFGIKLLQSANGEEETILKFNPKTEEFSIDRSKSSLSDLPDQSELVGKLHEIRDDKIQVHILLDHSIIEVFVNHQDCISTRVYPTRDDSVNVALFAEEGHSVRLCSMDVWSMNSI